ncbi:MAG TPA: hypothetical protein VD713_01030 [Sphingomonadales bacterium]|nr:hypothetical protein [Sphingomonadales bacterium]
MRKLPIAFAAGFVFCAVPVLAQQVPPPRVCEESPAYAEFDFWVGEWDVYSTDGTETYQGHNSIQKLAAGCLVYEHWTGAQGGEGYSMNYFDPVDGRWRQVWVSQNLSIDYSGGRDAEGRMVLEGTIHYYGPKASFPFRGIWKPNGDGTVLQHFDQQDPASGEWRVWFEGLYVPASAADGH